MKLLVGALMIAAVCSVECTAQSKGLRIVFQPDSDQFSEAAHQYQTIWADEGSRITAAMEAASGLDEEITVNLVDVSACSASVLDAIEREGVAL